MLRRVLAITLLVAFGSPLVAPLMASTADPQALLPACCRMHGKHHCIMPAGLPGASTDPAFQVPPCPFYPTTATSPVSATAALSSPLLLAVETRSDFAPLAPSRHRAQTFAVGANLKRGPPTLLG
jgi:hypothetical protein